MTTASYILVIDDEKDIRELVRDILTDEGYEVDVAENGERARDALRHRRPDLVLLDIWMPDIDGIALLREWSRGGRPDMPVIMISGHGTVETAVEATRLGAYDFLEKPLSLAKLLLTVRHALETYQLQRENLDLRRFGEPLSEPVGQSRTLVTLREQVQRVAQHNAWVLIKGEAGSGVELFARFLHNSSQRSGGPFVDVRVASMSGENPARELFGSEKDGIVSYGLLERANGGTLFFDEVADMEPAVQARLFSTLESRSFLRVGGNEPVAFDVRVVAGTHRDLEQEVRENRFRGDLYYLLNVVPIQVPPLREHPEDIPALLNYYVEMFAHNEHLPYRRFSTEAQNRLRNHYWAGNVLELKNLVQRLLILGSGDEITAAEVDHALGTIVGGGQQDEVFEMPLRQARTHFEREYFQYQLRHGEGNMGKVAQKAGIERTHLYRKLRSLGITTRPDGSDV